jgi:hypothetical protein
VARAILSWTTVRPETHKPLTRFLFEAEDDHPWWRFRRILDRTNFADGFARSDVTVVNWPQNDYWFGAVVGADPDERERNHQAARQLSLSLLYWLQTEAPRPDGGVGYPGLRLRGDDIAFEAMSSATRLTGWRRPRMSAKPGDCRPSSQFLSNTSRFR